MISDAMIPKGMSLLRIFGLFRRGGNRIEADIGKENDRSAGNHSRKSRRRKRMPVRTVHQHSANHQET